MHFLCFAFLMDVAIGYNHEKVWLYEYHVHVGAEMKMFKFFLNDIWNIEIVWFFLQLHWLCIEWTKLIMNHGFEKVKFFQNEGSVEHF